MRRPSGENAGKALVLGSFESTTRFCSACGPVANRPSSVTTPPTEHNASASRTVGRRRSEPDAIRFRLSQDARQPALHDEMAPGRNTMAAVDEVELLVC